MDPYRRNLDSDAIFVDDESSEFLLINPNEVLNLSNQSRKSDDDASVCYESSFSDSNLRADNAFSQIGNDDTVTSQFFETITNFDSEYPLETKEYLLSSTETQENLEADQSVTLTDFYLEYPQKSEEYFSFFEGPQESLKNNDIEDNQYIDALISSDAEYPQQINKYLMNIEKKHIEANQYFDSLISSDAEYPQQSTEYLLNIEKKRIEANQYFDALISSDAEYPQQTNEYLLSSEAPQESLEKKLLEANQYFDSLISSDPEYPQQSTEYLLNIEKKRIEANQYFDALISSDAEYPQQTNEYQLCSEEPQESHENKDIEVSQFLATFISSDAKYLQQADTNLHSFEGQQKQPSFQISNYQSSSLPISDVPLMENANKNLIYESNLHSKFPQQTEESLHSLQKIQQPSLQKCDLPNPLLPDFEVLLQKNTTKNLKNRSNPKLSRQTKKHFHSKELQQQSLKNCDHSISLPNFNAISRKNTMEYPCNIYSEFPQQPKECDFSEKLQQYLQKYDSPSSSLPNYDVLKKNTNLKLGNQKNLTPLIQNQMHYDQILNRKKISNASLLVSNTKIENKGSNKLQDYQQKISEESKGRRSNIYPGNLSETFLHGTSGGSVTDNSKIFKKQDFNLKSGASELATTSSSTITPPAVSVTTIKKTDVKYPYPLKFSTDDSCVLSIDDKHQSVSDKVSPKTVYKNTETTSNTQINTAQLSSDNILPNDALIQTTTKKATMEIDTIDHRYHTVEEDPNPAHSFETSLLYQDNKKSHLHGEISFFLGTDYYEGIWKAVAAAGAQKAKSILPNPCEGTSLPQTISSQLPKRVLDPSSDTRVANLLPLDNQSQLTQLTLSKICSSSGAIGSSSKEIMPSPTKVFRHSFVSKNIEEKFLLEQSMKTTQELSPREMQQELVTEIVHEQLPAKVQHLEKKILPESSSGKNIMLSPTKELMQSDSKIKSKEKKIESRQHSIWEEAQRKLAADDIQHRSMTEIVEQQKSCSERKRRKSEKQEALKRSASECILTQSRMGYFRQRSSLYYEPKSVMRNITEDFSDSLKRDEERQRLENKESTQKEPERAKRNLSQ